jgi:hypothetical protein
MELHHKPPPVNSAEERREEERRGENRRETFYEDIVYIIWGVLTGHTQKTPDVCS